MKRTITHFIALVMTALYSHATTPATREEVQEMLRTGEVRELPYSSSYLSNQDSGMEVKYNHNQTTSSRINDRRTAKSAFRLAPRGTSIYGYCFYSDVPWEEGGYYGLYEVMPSGLELKWHDPLNVQSQYYQMQGGYLQSDRIYGYIVQSIWGGIFQLNFGSVDFATGEPSELVPLDPFNGPLYARFIYSASEDMIYGFGAHPQQNGYVLMKTDPDTPGEAEVVSALAEKTQMPASICYNEMENAIYGVDCDGWFVRFSLDGVRTPLFQLTNFDARFTLFGGLVYSPLEKVYYWSFVRENNDISGLAIINPEEQSVELVQTYEDCSQFSYLLTTDTEPVNEITPACPLIERISFPEGATSGQVTYMLPTHYTAGSEITGELEIYTGIDGEYSLFGNGQPGERIEVTYNNLSNDRHVFGCYVIKDGEQSKTMVDGRFIGNDTPYSPNNVTLTSNEVSWEPVGGIGINGGYVSTSDLEYVVRIDGAEAGRTKESSLAITLPSDRPYAAYRAEVFASSNGKTSAPGVSAPVASGLPMNLPLSLTPTEAESELCSVDDTNRDGITWQYSRDALRISFSAPGVPQDDWLFLPPVKIQDPAKLYNFEFEVTAGSEYGPDEALEVFIGKSANPDGMTQKVINEFRPIPDWERIQSFVKVEEEGVYYIGFHCISAPDQNGVAVRHILLDDNDIYPDSPSKVEITKAIAADKGALEATVSFRFPTKTISGEDIPASTIMEGIVIGQNTASVSGAPGQEVSATVNTCQGDNELTAYASINGKNGQSSYVSVYTGVEVPALVRNLTCTAAKDMMSITLNWEAPLVGEYGGYIDPAAVTYNILIGNSSTGGFPELYQSGLTETTFSYTCEPGAIQDLYQFAVVAVNVAGDNGYYTSVSDILGMPWELPLEEDFEDGLKYTPWNVLYNSDGGKVSGSLYALGEIESGFDNPENVALVLMARRDGANCRLTGPRFTTKETSAAYVEMELFTGFFSTDYTIYAVCSSSPESIIKLGYVSGMHEGMGMTDVIYQLPEAMLNNDWVQIYIDCSFETNTNYGIIDSFKAVPGVSAVSSVKSKSGAVSASDGSIIIEGFAGKDAIIYAVNGVQIAEMQRCADKTVIPVQPGVYIVAIDDMRMKVSAR
jgi:hypothetical protein